MWITSKSGQKWWIATGQVKKRIIDNREDNSYHSLDGCSIEEFKKKYPTELDKFIDSLS